MDLAESMPDSDLATLVREIAGPAIGTTIDDIYLAAGVKGFVEAFDYWYARVVRNTVPQYREKIVSRINPFVRRIEFDQIDAFGAASRLVDDWSNRNFVTAGGWAIEALATDSSSTAQKSAAEGIDLQRHDPETGAHHLYVLKSGPVTRNSDIIKALKVNSGKAERLLQQSSKGRDLQVVKNYAVASGRVSSTFEDGVRRPSAGELWSELLGLPEDEAVELALAMASVAAPLVKQDAGSHLQALKLLVFHYIANEYGEVDWEFIATRTLRARENWRIDDERRHAHALEMLRESGYRESGALV